MFRKTTAILFALGLLCTVPIASNPVAAGAPASSSASDQQCEALAGTDFSGIEDAPTTIISVKPVAASGNLPGHCEVTGYAVPNIGFLAWLPTGGWNGKILQGGCGGTCGSLDGIAQCRDPLRRGYACIISDGGHRSTLLDMKWSYARPELMTDYYVRTPHIALQVGKALVDAYFKTSPKRSYFLGCSSGGTQALNAAQLHPWDYDGIVAVSPGVSVGDTMLTFIWGYQSLYAKDGTPVFTPDKLELLHKGVIDSCDMNDGIKDGLIGDPRLCSFRPEELQCKSEKGGQCLSAAQVAAANRIYEGPRTPDGQQIAPPQSHKGTELYWSFYAPRAGSATDFVTDWFRYYALEPNPGPDWDMSDFDFSKDYKRLGASGTVAPDNPDLRRFKARGGKLLLVSGWEDAFVSVPRLAEYYELAERLNGGRSATQDFFRAFFSPGMGHCGGGTGASSIDYLTYLENWVEKGDAPDKLLAYKVHDYAIEWNFEDFPLVPAQAKFSRPVYPYPVQSRYLGHGDPDDAANFGPDPATLPRNR